jgi:hypothetical protein
MKEEKPKSDFFANRPLDKYFAMSFDHWHKQITRLATIWEKYGKPHWSKEMREAKKQNDMNKYEHAFLNKRINENFIRERKDFLGIMGAFGRTAMDIDDIRVQVQSVVGQLEEIGLLKAEVKATAQRVADREKIFARISELWSGADIRERDYRKLLIYRTT